MASFVDFFVSAYRALRRGNPAGEGNVHAGPWLVMNPPGRLPAQWSEWNFWQLDHDPLALIGSSAVVEACVSAYAETIAMCPADHWRALPNGGRERVTTSALSRVLRWPNDYQSRSDFFLNLTRSLYTAGNSYALAERNDRFEVAALHPFDPTKSKPVVGPDEAIFYQLLGNNVLEGGDVGRKIGTTGAAVGGWDFDNTTVGAPALFASLRGTPQGRIVPARDVLHVKLEVERDKPLVGVPPLKHAGLAVAAQQLIGSQLINFFANMSRPSGVLETDLTLTKEQVEELRNRWNEQARGINAGGTPVLTAGLKYKHLSQMLTNAKDADLVNTLKLSNDEIFMVFGVPPAIIGMTDKGTFSSTEALMQFWLSRGLGFAINHIEVAFDQFFNLKGWPDEYVELDTRALLRTQFKDRIEALARGVQGGIYAPNEARNAEDLPDAPYGDEPRVQQQVVPLSAWAQTPPSTPAPPSSPAAGPAASTAPNGSDEGAAEENFEVHPLENVDTALDQFVDEELGREAA